MSYQKAVETVKQLNSSTYVGNKYRHVRRGSEYIITGFSVFKQSGESKLDETTIVHYMDAYGNPHTRPFGDFFNGNFTLIK